MYNEEREAKLNYKNAKTRNNPKFSNLDTMKLSAGWYVWCGILLLRKTHWENYCAHYSVYSYDSNLKRIRKRIRKRASDMSMNTYNPYPNTHYSRGGAMFSEAIIYYPKDEKAIKQINKDIAAFHSAVAEKYMDSSMELTPKQKVALLDELMQDIAQPSASK